MNTYLIRLKGYDDCPPITQFGDTPAKAKYNAFLEYSDIYEGFKDFIKSVESIRLFHKFQVSDLFGDTERFERMKKSRNIPFAFMGMNVILKSKNRGNIKGVIVGANSGLNIDVCFDGTTHKENCHPHYEMIYLDNDGNVIAEY